MSARDHGAQFVPGETVDWTRSFTPIAILDPKTPSNYRCHLTPRPDLEHGPTFFISLIINKKRRQKSVRNGFLRFCERSKTDTIDSRP